MTPYWLSFWSLDPSKWEYHGPWWITGERETREGAVLLSICCAVLAPNEDAAWGIVRAAHDPGHGPVEIRFTTDNPESWAPFTDRFVRRPWMQWPFPASKETAP